MPALNSFQINNIVLLKFITAEMGHIGREADLTGLTRDDCIEVGSVFEGGKIQRELSLFNNCLKDLAIVKVEYGDVSKLVSGYKTV